MSQPTITVPHAAFARVLNEYALSTTKAVRDTYNSRMLDLVIKAYRATKAADRGQIRAEMAREMPTNSGETISRAAVLANFRRKTKGMPALGGKDLATAARKLVASVSRSVGFIKSGWIPAMREFTRAKNRAATSSGGIRNIPRETGQRGRPKGSARAATALIRPEAIAENTTKVAATIGGPAVAQAMAEVQAGMERILRRNIEKATARLNGKVIR